MADEFRRAMEGLLADMKINLDASAKNGSISESFARMVFPLTKSIMTTLCDEIERGTSAQRIVSEFSSSLSSATASMLINLCNVRGIPPTLVLADFLERFADNFVVASNMTLEMQEKMEENTKVSPTQPPTSNGVH